jgi:hypothetical protein
LRKGLLLLLILLLTLTSVTQQYAIYASASHLSEHIIFFVTKDSILVSSTLSGGDISLTGLGEESLRGVNSYKLVASFVKDWLPAFHILGDEGYKVLPLTPTPKEGLTLIVDADEEARADSAAQALGRVVKAAFMRIAAEDHKYIYYSHCSFNYVSQILLGALPKFEGGFTNLLRSAFSEKSLQFIVLEGLRSKTGFSTQLTLQYAEARSLTPTFDLDTVLPGFSNTTVPKDVSESRVEVVFADALISSTPLPNVEAINFFENISSKLSFKIDSGGKAPLSKIQLTYYPPLIKVERVVDKGVVEAAEGRDTVEVTLRLENVAPANSLAAEDLAVNEEWWVGKFELVSGNASKKVAALKPGEKVEIPYVLRLTESSPSDLYVAGETTPITYTYRLGDRSFSGRAYPNDVRLVLNKPRPTLLVTAEPKEPNPSEAANKLAVKIVNVGARSAFNVTVTLAGYKVASKPVLERGESWVVEAPVKPEALTQPLQSVRVSVRWVDEEGEKVVSANTAPIRFSRSTSGAPKVGISQTVDASPEEGGLAVKGVVKVSLTSANKTRLKLSSQIPEGFELEGGDFTLNGRCMEASSIFEGAAERTFNYLLRSNRSLSFVQPPFSAEVEWSGFTLKVASNSYAYAGGLKVTQEVSKPSAFRGSTSDVKVSIVNLGPFPIYDLKVRSLNHSYAAAQRSERAVDVLEAGQSVTLDFSIHYLNTGSYDYVPIAGSFIFSAQNQTLRAQPISLHIEKPPRLSLTPPNSLIEKQEATITFTLSNPSQLTVYDVVAEVVFSGTEAPKTPIVIRVDELRSGQSISKALQITPSSVLSLKIASKLSFRFEGEVLEGEPFKTELAVAENLQLRYALPVAIGVAAIIVTAYLSRQKFVEETQPVEQRGKAVDV